MIRILFEISLPAHTVVRVAESLDPSALPAGIRGRLERVDSISGCGGPARAGEASWTPCWISVEAGRYSDAFETAVRSVRERVIQAAREGNTVLFAIPASVQVGDEFRRAKDVLDALLLSRGQRDGPPA